MNPPGSAPARQLEPLRFTRAGVPVPLLQRAAAGLGLVVFAVPMGVIAMLIVALDGRPVFVRHYRVFGNGRIVGCLHFRTRPQAVQVGPSMFGLCLVRSGLRALPQLVNVMFGERALTGPRPVAFRRVKPPPRE